MSGRGIRLTVEDNGPGVPEAERGRILQRSYRLEQSRTTPGNGLGLSLAVAIAELQGAGVALADARPGLRVSVVFAEPALVQATTTGQDRRGRP
jgi:signal transduction histidine kinase